MSDKRPPKSGAGVTVSISIAAPIATVWDAVSDLGSHVVWMADAESITFRSEQRSGVGTMMDVVTKVGPLRTTDIMRVTEWVESRSISVTHVGAVRGAGRFTLEEAGSGTRFEWSEHLQFPWYFAGRIGAWMALPIFRRIWRSNLSRLKAHIEG